ncbi:MAG: hypothetical protein KME21_22000 [Desmonostoc vinosum HA7617-LM4]|jgi:uncharacterized protein YpuA (DUF1002 family)|nr:hypothetical protein [Desmonostoc vinosum HA7617-LM4]
MNQYHHTPYKTSIWANIDFDKVKNRIDEVTQLIEQVMQKYGISIDTPLT